MEGETAEARDESGPTPEAPTARNDEPPAQQAAAEGPAPQERAAEALVTTDETDSHPQAHAEPADRDGKMAEARDESEPTPETPTTRVDEPLAQRVAAGDPAPEAVRRQPEAAAQPAPRRSSRIANHQLEAAANETAAIDAAAAACKKQTATKVASGPTRPCPSPPQ
jgi:hypothetical protein